MKFQSVLVVSMFAFGVSLMSASAHASTGIGICSSFDSSCSGKPTCATSNDCAADPVAKTFSLTVCDTGAGKCVTPWSASTGLGGLLGGVTCGLVGALTCKDSNAPVCNTAGLFAGTCSECSATDSARCGTYAGARPTCMVSKGLCGCSADTDCASGKSCSQLLHQCIATLSLPSLDGGTVPTVPTVPSVPSASSSSGGTGDDTTPSADGTTSSSSSGGSGSASSTTGASASAGDAGLDAEAAVAADGGCSTGGHGSGVTFLGVLGAAFALAATRRRRVAR